MLKHVIEVIEAIDRASIGDRDIESLIPKCDYTNLEIEKIVKDGRTIHVVRYIYRGPRSGRAIAVIGRLGGVGARPRIVGLVSDADGAIVALALARKISYMCMYGDHLPGEVYIATSISTHSIVRDEKPAPMISPPIDLYSLIEKELAFKGDPEAYISVDATKANKIIKVEHFAVTPVVVRGWIIPPSEDLLDLYTAVTGRDPAVVPITMQDIVPYTTRVKHINSILQAWLYTDKPVVGVATTSPKLVPGSATGVTNAVGLDMASRYILEVVKGFNSGDIELYSRDDLDELVRVHGEVKHIFARGLLDG